MMYDFESPDERTLGPVDPYSAVYCLRLLAAAPVTPRLIKAVNESPQVSTLLGTVMDEKPLDSGALAKRTRVRLKEETAAAGNSAQALHRNIAILAGDLKLTPAEAEVLRFALLLHAEPIIDATFEVARAADPSDLYQVVAIACALPVELVKQALNRRGTLHCSGLVQVDRNWRFDSTIRSRLDVLQRFGVTLSSDAFSSEDLLSYCASRAPASTLEWRDYTHLKPDLTLVQRVLKAALKGHEQGVNILLWGPPGTGKTEFARLLGSRLGCVVREIVHEDDDGDALNPAIRARVAVLAQRLFRDVPDTVLVFDEMEDLMSSGFRQDTKRSVVGKAWLNSFLETNKVPTIWISNDADEFDPAILRRFSMAVAFEVPPVQARKRIIRRQLEGLELGPKLIAELANIRGLPPAAIAQAARVTKLAGARTAAAREDALRRALAGTTNLLRLRPKKQKPKDKATDIPYDLRWVNADVELPVLVDRIREVGSARLCLYGAPGTGKTEFGRQLAKRLRRPLIVRRASDLLGPYVGQTEQLLAKAFQEATSRKAILLIDEADSFIYSREGVTHAWQRSMVNEFLTQMETFEGILICSTNMVNALDEASARRFDLQVRFDALRPEQAWSLFQATARSRKVTLPHGLATETLRGRIGQLAALTPGDFAKAIRGGRLLEQKLDAEGLCSAVERVAASKTAGSASHAMGFVWEDKRAC